MKVTVKWAHDIFCFKKYFYSITTYLNDQDHLNVKVKVCKCRGHIKVRRKNKNFFCELLMFICDIYVLCKWYSFD